MSQINLMAVWQILELERAYWLAKSKNSFEKEIESLHSKYSLEYLGIFLELQKRN